MDNSTWRICIFISGLKGLNVEYCNIITVTILEAFLVTIPIQEITCQQTQLIKLLQFLLHQKT